MKGFTQVTVGGGYKAGWFLLYFEFLATMVEFAGLMSDASPLSDMTHSMSMVSIMGLIATLSIRNITLRITTLEVYLSYLRLYKFILMFIYVYLSYLWCLSKLSKMFIYFCLSVNYSDYRYAECHFA
jgi:hypothetical protein